ncbi:MAG: alpha/beta hydrolase fold domain-containing protein [Coriobacteriales bacterium]|nr:alpha/beta hydrolase fold domain-containing protein [Coriobacteriales bacterium]
MTQGPSFTAKVVAALIRIVDAKSHVSYEQAYERWGSAALRAGEPEYQLPHRPRMHCTIHSVRMSGMKVFRLNGRSDAETIIFYHHGGGWVKEPNPFHWRFLDKLIEATGVAAIVPVYLKAPFHDSQESLDCLEDFYLQYRELHPDKRIIFMGDSAGASISLNLMQRFAAKGIEQPAAAILLAPVCDLALDNPLIPDIDPKDCMLHQPSCKAWGDLWANGRDSKDPLISPLFADVDGLPPITLYYGTADILYPDGELMFQKLQEAGVECQMLVAPGMGHVYPLWPFAPESKQASAAIFTQVKELAAD